MLTKDKFKSNAIAFIPLISLHISNFLHIIKIWIQLLHFEQHFHKICKLTVTSTYDRREKILKKVPIRHSLVCVKPKSIHSPLSGFVKKSSGRDTSHFLEHSFTIPW